MPPSQLACRVTGDISDSCKIEHTFFIRSRVRGSLRAWAEVALADSGYRPAAHQLYLMSELEALSAGKLDRLMVLMPPGSAKSTYGSVNTDLWGAYLPIPAVAGTYYLWAAGLDGSATTVNPTPITVQ